MLGLFRLSSDELGHAGNGEGNDPVVGGVHETLVDKIGSDRAKGVDRLPKAICYLPGADTDVAFRTHRAQILLLCRRGPVPPRSEEPRVELVLTQGDPQSGIGLFDLRPSRNVPGLLTKLLDEVGVPARAVDDEFQCIWRPTHALRIGWAEDGCLGVLG